MNLHSLLALFLSLLPALSPSSFATSFYIRPFREFTQSTPNIVRGTLNNVHVDNTITPEGVRTIYTFASVEIKEVLKGNIQKQSIIIRKIGGTKDGYTLEIPSSPEFTEGEDSVLFLGPENTDQTYEVTDLELGKFGIEEKNGESFLSGGIFNYSKDLAENQIPWSLSHLREVIKTQGASTNGASTETAPTLPFKTNPSLTPSLHPENNSESRASIPETFQNKETHAANQSDSSILLFFAAVIFLAIAIFFFRKKS